jgi:hypothetical protein
MRTLPLAVCAAAVLTCSACADGGGAFVPAASAHFAPGVTTRAEAITALGAPSAVYEAADGEKTVTWARDGGLFNSGETRQYSVLFGTDDKMIRVVSPP